VLTHRAGAFIGTELALARPEQVTALVMVSVPLPSPGQRREFAVEPPVSPSQRSLAAALTQYPARERIARLTQQLLVVRPRDELWESTWGIREVLPAARVADLDLPGAQVLAAAPERLFEVVRDFLRA
jgi:pimeloyl-ACP methyl ester carboxylesterase